MEDGMIDNDTALICMSRHNEDEMDKLITRPCASDRQLNAEDGGNMTTRD